MSKDVYKITLKELEDITKMISEVAEKENEKLKYVKYILHDKDNKNNIIVAANIGEDGVPEELQNNKILVCNFENGINKENNLADTWDFSYDLWIFQELEKGNKEISYISPETHQEIHEEIENMIDKLEYKDGCEKYLDYFLKVATITKIKVKQIGIDRNNNPIYMDDNWNIYTDAQPMNKNTFIKNIQNKIDKDKSNLKKKKDRER